MADFESYMPKHKRDDLKLSSQGMVKKTVSKKDPTKVWVSLGLDTYVLMICLN